LLSKRLCRDTGIYMSYMQSSPQTTLLGLLIDTDASNTCHALVARGITPNSTIIATIDRKSLVGSIHDA
jgi:hypothetical protein